MQDFRCEISYIDKYDDLNIISRFDVVNPKFILEDIKYKIKDHVPLSRIPYNYNLFKHENNFKSHISLLRIIAALEVIRGSYYLRDKLDIWTFSNNAVFHITFKELTKDETLFNNIQTKYIEEPDVSTFGYSVEYMYLNKIIDLHSGMIKYFCNLDDNDIAVETNRWMINSPNHNLSERILCALVAQEYEVMKNNLTFSLISIEK